MTDALSVALRFALYVDLMLLFGLPLFALYAPSRETERQPATGWGAAAALAAVALLLSVLAMIVVCAAMAGVAPTAIDRATFQMVVTTTSIGTAWQARMAVLAALLLITAFPARRGELAKLLASAGLGGAALATLAWTGHGAAGEGAAGMVQLAADIVHLLAAGAWLGGLAGFLLVLARAHAGRSRDDLAFALRALTRFATVGTILVVLIVATGLANGFALVGLANLPTLPQTLYGQLLIVKLVLFVAMLGLAAVNRFRLTPALGRAGDDGAALGAIRRSIAFETLAAVAILALVAWLGTLPPPGMG